MRKIFFCLVALAISSTAHAGQYQDRLNKCISAATTDKDRTDLARWAFAVIGQHPAMNDIVGLSPEKREELHKTFGQLITRLLGESCGKETQDVFEYEGKAAARASFELLGKIAMESLMTNPAVSEGFRGPIKYIDLGKIEAAFKAK